MTRRWALLLVPVLLTLHNLEEALTFAAALPRVRVLAPEFARPLVADVTYPQLLVALALATVVPWLVTLWALGRPASRAALWCVLALQAVVALNVVSHLTAGAALFGGYGPGLATALALNLPFSVYLLRRAARERWVTRRALWSLVPTALVVHGPGLVGLILLGGAFR